MGLLLRRHHDGPADATAESADAVATSADEDRPNKSALKPEWEAYAVAQGMSAEDADKATKKQLVDQYGGDA